ncbi:MAG: YfdX family protein [Oligoflexia bacterium]|nr:YfdX family protein [Oligoflexia bacterium]
MRKNRWIVASLAAFVLAQGQAPMTDRSKQLSQERIESESAEAVKDPTAKPVTEAVAAVTETRTAVQYLDQNRPDQARDALSRAIVKSNIVSSMHPMMTLVPVSFNLQVTDTIASDATLKRVTEEVKKLVDSGQYQAARPLLRDLASEIDVTTVNLPIATYPSSLRSAASLIDRGKVAEAKSQLLSALHSLVINERIIPLPVVRAQALVEEVNRQVLAKKVDKEQASIFLSDADQQLALAEKLGYGTRKQDFSDLRASIQEIKRSIRLDQQPQTFIARVKSDLQSLKERIWNAVAAV